MTESITSAVPLPCHGIQPTYTCAWCHIDIPRHTPTPAELELVATIYGNGEGMRLAAELGVHPALGEIGRIFDERGWTAP